MCWEKRIGMALAICMFATVHTAHAVDLWSSDAGDRYYALDTSLKWTTLLSHAPEDTVLFPERWSAATLWRMRLNFRAQPTSWLNIRIAYEQRARSISEGSGSAGGTGILLSENRAPYRISQIDASLVEVGRTFSYRHELDRFFTAMHFGKVECTAGRQAVGWGRGVIFSAVDIFAPFTPLESDREWRRGIDAIRGSIPLSDLISFETVAAIGESPETSSFAGRLHGYIGDIDGEVIFGRRSEDYLYAVTASSPVYGAELHGEFALFKTPESFPDGGLFGRDDLVTKAVIGGSYSLDIGHQVYLAGEYHYTGFGVKDVKQAQIRLQDPVFRARYLRGDTQILGRHACAVQVACGIEGAAPLNLSWIFSPVDGSGVLAPSVQWLFSDNLTLIGQLFFPYGAGPVNGEIRSEYGGTPASGLAQIRFYY